MKKMISCFAIVCLLTAFAVCARAYEGAGSEDNPFQISTRADLDALAADVKGGNVYKNVYFCLTANIDMGGTDSPWTAIGMAENMFAGIFDGQGHSIINLHVAANADNGGLFAYTRGTVKNVTISEPKIINVTTYGCIAVNNYGTVSGCAVVGTTTINGKNGAGIVASNYGTVEKCYCTNNVSSTLMLGAGIVADNKEGCMVRNCHAQCDVNVVGMMVSAGGIVASNSGAIENCYSTGRVAGINLGVVETFFFVGGFAGSSAAPTSSIKNCYCNRETIGYEKALGQGTGDVSEYTSDEMKTDSMVKLLNGTQDPALWIAVAGDYPHLNLTSAPVKYEVTVNSGSGSGEYAVGATVTIVADAPPYGQVFAAWEADTTGLLANPTEATTSFTMPNGAVTLTATYTTAPDGAYALTVTGGTPAYTKAETGTTVNVSATIPEGQRFVRWLLNGEEYSFEPNTVYTIGNADAVLTAEFAEVSAYTLTVVNGTPATASLYTGDTILVRADAFEPTPTLRKVFKQWTKNGTVVSKNNPYVFTMGEEAVTLTAEYTEIVPHLLTVINGSPDTALLFSGDTILVHADVSDTPFAYWTIDGILLATTPDYVYTMGNQNATIQAVYGAVVDDTYTLTVADNGIVKIYELKSGAKCPINTLGTVAEGFLRWEAQGDVLIANAKAQKTQVTMKMDDAVVYAVYAANEAKPYGFALKTLEGKLGAAMSVGFYGATDKRFEITVKADAFKSSLIVEPSQQTYHTIFVTGEPTVAFNGTKKVTLSVKCLDGSAKFLNKTVTLTFTDNAADPQMPQMKYMPIFSAVTDSTGYAECSISKEEIKNYIEFYDWELAAFTFDEDYENVTLTDTTAGYAVQAKNVPVQGQVCMAHLVFTKATDDKNAEPFILSFESAICFGYACCNESRISLPESGAYLGAYIKPYSKPLARGKTPKATRLKLKAPSDAGYALTSLPCILNKKAFNAAAKGKFYTDLDLAEYHQQTPIMIFDTKSDEDDAVAARVVVQPKINTVVNNTEEPFTIEGSALGTSKSKVSYQYIDEKSGKVKKAALSIMNYNFNMVDATASSTLILKPNAKFDELRQSGKPFEIIVDTKVGIAAYRVK